MDALAQLLQINIPPMKQRVQQQAPVTILQMTPFAVQLAHPGCIIIAGFCVPISKIIITQICKDKQQQ